MFGEVNDQMEVDEESKNAEGKNNTQRKNMMEELKNAMSSERRRTKKVRSFQCSYLTKSCVLFRKLLSEIEVDQIHKLAAISMVEGWGSRQKRNFGKTGSKQSKYAAVKTGGHTVTFLEEKFEKRLPRIFSLMNKVMRQVDYQTKWNISKRKVLSPRRMEFLQYSSKDNPIYKKKKARKKKHHDGLGWHFDTDSLLNLVCMCSNKDEFEGGLLQIKVKSKNGGVRIITVPEFDRGDAVIFLSERTEHRVTPTTGGVRCTFVYELWDYDGYDDGTDTSSGCGSTSSSSNSTS